MKSFLCFVLSSLFILSCGKKTGSQNAIAAGDEIDNPPQVMSARMGKFSAILGQNGNLVYFINLYIDEGVFDGGKFNIYDCQNSSCSTKFEKYVIECTDNLECRLRGSSEKPTVSFVSLK